MESGSGRGKWERRLNFSGILCRGSNERGIFRSIMIDDVDYLGKKFNFDFEGNIIKGEF